MAFCHKNKIKSIAKILKYDIIHKKKKLLCLGIRYGERSEL